MQEASKEIVPKDITHRKTLQELTLKDNFLFAAVMIDPENCRQLLELALGLEIECVEVDTEKSIVYHPEYKGVRLDVYTKDEHHTRFNVEMQVARQIGGRYMLFEELLRNEHREGFTEGMEQGLTRGMEQGKAEAYAKIQKACADMPEDIRQQILSAMDNDAREIIF